MHGGLNRNEENKNYMSTIICHLMPTNCNSCHCCMPHYAVIYDTCAQPYVERVLMSASAFDFLPLWKIAGEFAVCALFCNALECEIGTLCALSSCLPPKRRVLFVAVDHPGRCVYMKVYISGRHPVAALFNLGLILALVFEDAIRIQRQELCLVPMRFSLFPHGFRK